MLSFVLSVTMYLTNPAGKNYTVTKYYNNTLHSSKKKCLAAGKQEQAKYNQPTKIKCMKVNKRDW